MVFENEGNGRTRIEAAVTDGEIKIHPGDKFLATYKYWLENVKDWCISRQLWWGQQIPAWYDEKGNVFVAETEEEAKQQQLQHAAGAEANTTTNPGCRCIGYLVLVMVVANGSFSTAFQIRDNKEINYYYPTAVLVTGQDIIFFWVARMIMAGMHYKM